MPTRWPTTNRVACPPQVPDRHVDLRISHRQRYQVAAWPENYNKGSEIVHTVKRGERSGDTLQADVQGHLLYAVMVTVRDDTGIDTVCTCPAASSGGGL